MSEYRRQREAMLRRQELTRELAARKRKREAAARRERTARENAAFLSQLPPERIYQPRPELAVSAGFSSLRNQLSDEERARRADRQLRALGIRRKAESRPAPTGPTRLARGGGEIVRVY